MASHLGMIRALRQLVQLVNTGGLVMNRNADDYRHSILSYLTRHPQAQDTVEGIAEWWVMDQHLHVILEEIQDALAALVRNQYLVEKRRQDGRVYYALNLENMDKIQQFLSLET